MTFKILALVIMIENFYFAFSTIFLWDKPRTRRKFGLSMDFASRTKKFAVNLGVGQLLLAIAFVLGFIYFYSNETFGHYILVYCMFCSFVSSLILGLSFNIRFFLMQGIPAIVGLFLIF